MTTAQREPGNSQDSEGASMPHGERRGHARVAVDLFVQERDGDRLFVHPATNLSASGIFSESHSYSLRNALDRHFIDLEFQLPAQDKPISVRGEVIGARRTRGFSHGLAVRFLDLSEGDRQALSAYVEHKLAEGAGEGPASEAAPL